MAHIQRGAQEHDKHPNHAHQNKFPQQSNLLLWEAFLPGGEKDSEKNIWPQRQGPRKPSFQELLDEEKKRLEKVEQGQELRKRGEVLGAMGEWELEDLLADLCEPSFSRRQNEKLRRGMAARLRAKVARLFGSVMSQYYSGTDGTNRRSAEHGMTRATATFRVKLNHLLDSSYLGELQDQVTKDIAGTSRTPVSRVRQRECCTNKTLHGSKLRVSPKARKSVHTSASGAVGIPTVNTVGTHGEYTEPHPPRMRASTAIPVVAANAKGRSRSTVSVKPASPGRLLATAVEAVHRNNRQGAVGSSPGVDQQHPSSPSASVGTQEHEYDESCTGNNIDSPSALGGLGSLDYVQTSGHFSNGSSDEYPSGEDSLDCYEGKYGSQSSSRSSSGSSSSSSNDNGFLSRSEENEAEVLPCPAEPLHDGIQQGNGDDEMVAQTIVEAEELERRDDVPAINESTKTRDSKALKTPRRERQDKHKKKKLRPEDVNTGIGDAWSSRWLTVLLTELGIHQSRQRTLLSKHMPAKFKADGNKAGEESEIKVPPLTRIDRPHFRPVFVELPAAGKGCTLLMCPEPVAPGYEYSDVIEEVVKLHPPVGQLLLEEIDRGNIMTRSDALAHVESFERGAVSSNAKLLVDEFLAENEVRDLLASAETLELDLAQCAASGTLLNNDDVP